MDTSFQNKQIRDIIREELAMALDTQLNKLAELNKTIDKPKRQFLTAKEVCLEYGISDRSLINWQHRGLKNERVGRKKYYAISTIEAFLKSQTEHL